MSRQDRAIERMKPLRRRSDVPMWLSLSWRALAVFGLIGVVLTVHWFDRAGLRDNVDNHISFPDVLYFTMITITTVGFGDIVPVTQQARMFDTFVVTPIRLFVWLIFLGTAYDFVFKRAWERWRMATIQKNLNGHVVVAGYGTSGAEAVRELIARGTPADSIVVVDPSADRIAHAEEVGCPVLEGDATRDSTLTAVKIAHAQALIVSAGRDDTSILIVLTARHLAPDLPISIAVSNEDNELPARQAGATTVINPSSFAGLLLAGSCHGAHIADYLADLAAANGRVKLQERLATAQEIGTPLSGIASGLGVRLYRQGRPVGFWEDGAKALMTGDMIVEIVPGDGELVARG